MDEDWIRLVPIWVGGWIVDYRIERSSDDVEDDFHVETRDDHEQLALL